MNASSPSPAARLLGYAGLIPFVAAAVASHGPAAFAPAAQAAPSAPIALMALVGYGATIAAFLGGVHWGLAFREAAPPTARLAWGVTPPLLAWVAVMLPAASGLVLLAVTLVLALIVDRRVYPTLGLQGWLPMRLHLTAVAALCCLVGALAAGAGPGASSP